MKTKLSIFYPALTDFLNSAGEILVEGNNVGDCLKDFTRRFPGTDTWVFNSQGEVHEHLFVYINAESAHPAALDAPVKEGNELLLVVLFIGG